VKSKLFWSVLLSVLGIVLAYGTGMITAVYTTLRRNKTADSVVTAITIILFSIPSFWFAIVLLLLFANPDTLSILPVSGVKPIEGHASTAGFISQFITTLPYLVLPTMCYAYATYAVVTQTFNVSLLEEMKLDYIHYLFSFSDRWLTYH
jgi:peptide/nickel transport system permease protein